MTVEDKVEALRKAFESSVPVYCSGTCGVPPHQLLLYYGRDEAVIRRVDLSNASDNELGDLYQACQRATFGRQKKDVFDETYRKAGKMELNAFSTLFDPRSVGIHKHIQRGLLPSGRPGFAMELYKLNVYGKDDFFKPHRDTPRGKKMFGSLVVVLPAKHEGGALVLRHGQTDWTVDLGQELATSDKPCVGFVAFFSDIEHEVMPITSGYRVTLTYNLYYDDLDEITHRHAILLSPYHQNLKEALSELIMNEDILPNGGYLSFGLQHAYVYDDNLEILRDKLKGADNVLAEVCKELGLEYDLKVIYRDLGYEEVINLLCSRQLWVDQSMQMETRTEVLESALDRLGIDDAEVVNIIGRPAPDEEVDLEDCCLMDYCKNPLTEVLEVRMETSLSCESAYVSYGNEASLGDLYGDVCLVIAVKPNEQAQEEDSEDAEEDEQAEE